MLYEWLNDLAQEEHEKTASAQFEEVLQDMDIPELQALYNMEKEALAPGRVGGALKGAVGGGALGAGVGAGTGAIGGALSGEEGGAAQGARTGAAIGGLTGILGGGLQGAASGPAQLRVSERARNLMNAEGVEGLLNPDKLQGVLDAGRISGGEQTVHAIGSGIGAGGGLGLAAIGGNLAAKRRAAILQQQEEMGKSAMLKAAEDAGKAMAELAAEGELPRGFSRRPEAIVRSSARRDTETPVDPELAASEAASRNKLMRPADIASGGVGGGLMGAGAGYGVAGIPGAVVGGAGGAALGGGAGYGLNRLMDRPVQREAMLQALRDRDKLEAARASSGEEIPKGFALRPGGIVRESPWRGMPTPVDPSQAREEQLRLMRSARGPAAGVMGAAGGVGGALMGGAAGGVPGAVVGGLGGAALGAGGTYGLSRLAEGPAGRAAEAQALEDKAKLERMQSKTGSFREAIIKAAEQGELRTHGIEKASSAPARGFGGGGKESPLKRLMSY